MISISQKQAAERWDILPDDLRDAMVSDVMSDFVDKTCLDEHIPAGKIDLVQRIVCMVISGFLHPEDMSSEIADALKIDRRIADLISGAINQRVFVPIRPMIDAAYRLGTAGPISLSSIGGPTIVQEIRPPATLGASRPLSQPISFAPKIQSTIPQLGAMSRAASSPAKPSRDKNGSMVSVPVPPQVPVPAPFMMTDDVSAKPISKAPDLHMVSDDKISFASKFNQPVGASSRPAILEFGDKVPLPPKPPSKPLGVPLPPAPRVGREIHEVVEATLDVPLPPKPPTVPLPRPPMPPASGV